MPLSASYNFAERSQGFLSVDIGASNTSITLESGNGATFSAQPLVISIQAETIIAASRSGDVLSFLTRGAGGTSAVGHGIKEHVREFFGTLHYNNLASNIEIANNQAQVGLTIGRPLLAISATASGFSAIDLASADATTGALLVSRGGTALTATPTNGQLPIGNGTGFTMGAITGTANRVTVTLGAGTIALSGPQDLHTTAITTFGELIIGSAAGGGTGTIRTKGTGAITNTLETASSNQLQLSLKNSTVDWGIYVDQDNNGGAGLSFFDNTNSKEILRLGTGGATARFGFFGVTPVAKQATITQTYSTAATTITQTTMTDPATYGAGANGYSTGAMAAAVHAEVIALKANMVVTQNVLNSVIDALQAYGLMG